MSNDAQRVEPGKDTAGISPELRYRFSWTELLLGIVLWSLFLFGWVRAMSYSTYSDLWQSITFVVVFAAVYLVFVSLWVLRCIRRSPRRRRRAANISPARISVT